MTVKPPLNTGQQEAADAFLAFLFGPETYFIISGPGGVGKTHLMSHLIDTTMIDYFNACQMSGIKPEFDEVVMTATTNKAAEVLAVATGRPTSTIHSFLGLKVQENYSTGKLTLTKSTAWKIHERKILFVDEASMIDSPLLQLIKEGTLKCKIVFVGDHCQLAPVMEPISPIYRHPCPFYELTEPMRNSGQPALMALCNQLRETVKTGIFTPIRIVPGVIDHLDDEAMEAELARQFHTQTLDTRILAYTNGRVMEYNEHIRQNRALPEEYQIGEYLINNSAIRLSGTMLSVEEEVTIVRQDSKPHAVVLEDNVEMMVRNSDLTSRLGETYYNVPVPVDRAHHTALIKYYASQKKWPIYFDLKNKYPDLRQRDAATFHKSQGSTYDSVFIDLTNLSSCHQPNVVARMLNVAVSRPRSRIFFYGKLADKYGGLIH